MEFTPEAREKIRASQQAAAERQRARNIEKLADPEYRQRQFDKTRSAQERQREKTIARLKSPEYREQQKAKRAQKRVTSVNAPSKKRTTIKSRGTKGRTPTAAERRIMEKLGALPCIACLKHGKTHR